MKEASGLDIIIPNRLWILLPLILTITFLCKFVDQHASLNIFYKPQQSSIVQRRKPISMTSQMAHPSLRKSCFNYHHLKAHPHCCQMLNYTQAHLHQCILQPEGHHIYRDDFLANKISSTKRIPHWVFLGNSRVRMMCLTIIRLINKDGLHITDRRRDGLVEYMNVTKNPAAQSWVIVARYLHKEPFRLTCLWDPFLKNLQDHMHFWQRNPDRQPTRLFLDGALGKNDQILICLQNLLRISKWINYWPIGGIIIFW
ncbi:unnamed protein product [Meganyctiphanes norvegica]|uniref:Uncharacterized protein n=1 Tax=Meganyctiphanes norvegica TaxID=48144 RepID=A0AAV2PJ91_MEGNR